MILLIDNNDSFTYNIVETIRSITDEKIDVVKSEKVILNDIENYQKIIFSPGPSLPRDFPIMWSVLDRYKKTKKILGICLGHQAICEYFGAKIERLDHLLHGVDSMVKCDSNSTLFRGKKEMVVGRYHSWIACGIVEPLNVTAVDTMGRVMAVEHRRFPIYGVQFHPESHITIDGMSIFENFINE